MTPRRAGSNPAISLVVILNEEFEIAYFMKIPGELKQLQDNDEVMSISLNRYKKRVENLMFSVCLNFEPLNYGVFLRNINGRPEKLVTPVKKEKFSFDQSSIPQVIKQHFDSKLISAVTTSLSINIDRPNKETYVIYYKKAE